MSWTTEEKAEMFDQIAEHYYKKNYGSFSKSDMDLLMFSFFLEKKLEECSKDNGLVDYNSVSNYRISQELGITQQKVKSLKIKKQLVYPISYDWKKAFATMIANARYDNATKKITISIPDPNLLIEIQNFVEEKGGYIDTQINSKLLIMRVEYFLELALLVSDELSKNDVVKELKKSIKKNKKDESLFDEKNIGKSLLALGVNVASIAADISSLVNPSNLIFNAFCNLISSNR